jgi:hypothetical protein
LPWVTAGREPLRPKACATTNHGNAMVGLNVEDVPQRLVEVDPQSAAAHRCAGFGSALPGR